MPRRVHPLDHKIGFLLAGQLSFAVSVAWIVNSKTQHIVPHDWNATAWSNFSGQVHQEFHVSSKPWQVLLLLTMHMMHLYCYLPMLHVTKIVYGYWLGFWTGWLLCVAWELLLLLVFLQFVRRYPGAGVQPYVTHLREKGVLFFQLTLIVLSSLPLQAKTLLVALSNVTNKEYLLSNVGPTLVLSLQTVACGAVLVQHHGPNAGSSMLYGLVAFSLILPTLSSMLVSTQALFVFLQHPLPLAFDTGSHVETPARKTHCMHSIPKDDAWP